MNRAPTTSAPHDVYPSRTDITPVCTRPSRKKTPTATNIREPDGDTIVCPGHGPDTTVAIEKRQNPFLT